MLKRTRKKWLFVMLVATLLAAFPLAALAERDSIDISAVNEGYVTLYYISEEAAKFRVSVQMNGSEQFHSYTGGSRARIKLPGSGGEVTVTLYQLVTGNSYKKVEERSFSKERTADDAEVLLQSSTTIAPVLREPSSGGSAGGGAASGGSGGGMEITDIPASGGSSIGGGGEVWTANRVVPPEYQKYLASNAEISFSAGDAVSRKAAELVAGKATTEAQVMAIYSYIVENFSYDWDLYNAVKSGRVTTYTPDPNSVLNKRKGICYDIASLFAAMTRSVGIPTKMVKGNATVAGGYHAWNSIYEFESLSWVDLDATMNLGGKATSLYKALGRGYSAQSSI